MLTDNEEIELLRLLEIENIENAKNNYYDYVKYTHSDIYTYTRHGEYICNTVNEAIEKRIKMINKEIPTETQYLIYTVPAQHGKSMHITETLPSYFFGKFPNNGCIEISYNEDFASKFGKRNKEKINIYGKELFDISIPNDNRSASEYGIEYKNKRTRGGMISRGIMSGITGSSLGDLIIMDDVVKNRQEANSLTTRNAQWNEWTDSISKRIHPGAIVILIMTRWHEDDLAGRLLNNEYGEVLPWKVHNLPIECDEYHIEKEGNPLDRELGEPLWPEMYGQKEILKRKQYPATFSAMDQGRPTAAEGNMIKKEWFEKDTSWYNPTPQFIKQIPIVCMSVDATFKNTAKSDKVAIGIWGKFKNIFYLIDELNQRMDFLATLQAIRNFKQMYPNIGYIFIEDKANGSAIINVLSKELTGIAPVNPMGGKEARVQAVLPYLLNNVKLPRNKAFTGPMLQEWYSFPNGVHDDSVDEMSQAISQMLYYYGEKRIVEDVIEEDKEYNAMGNWNNYY